ncbi:HK97 family phage prohead protease [Gellertiella hungarica]|uniref:Prohead serine protease domain-containing protein n=1 Tax=Gellertiella hungarica TaxID=1572859 RepID=A0A7W6NLY3_9HYPH|nr:HK97 family phage prohead protease [Gellertiella hungarica]MBB4067010.1 hypothetical protein [Gellertiella hungarica]
MADEITGYVARFNREAVIAGAWREVLAPGCFTRSLRDFPDVVALLDHDSGRVIGRTSAGTLELAEDAQGLRFRLMPDPSTPSGQEALGTVRRGDVRGCSFGFFVADEEWQDGGKRLPLRIIKEVELFEITLTAFPAYGDDTEATLSGTAGAAARAAAKMRARGITS